jgi:hypothetical protein
MSVPKINNLNYCKTWMGVCTSFGDIEYQKRCWFREEDQKPGEDCEVGSLGEDFTTMDYVFRMIDDSERDQYLNKECNNLIKLFVEKLWHYKENPEKFFTMVDENELFNDPQWIEIVHLAQEIMKALKKFEQEITNV